MPPTFSHMENVITKDIALEYYKNKNILAGCYKIRLIYVVFRTERFSRNQYLHRPIYPKFLKLKLSSLDLNNYERIKNITASYPKKCKEP